MVENDDVLSLHLLVLHHSALFRRHFVDDWMGGSKGRDVTDYIFVCFDKLFSVKRSNNPPMNVDNSCPKLLPRPVGPLSTTSPFSDEL